MYSFDDSGHQVDDIIERRASYVDCSSPATTSDDMSLTIYRDIQNMNCYRPSDTPGKYLSDESG